MVEIKLTESEQIAVGFIHDLTERLEHEALGLEEKARRLRLVSVSNHQLFARGVSVAHAQKVPETPVQIMYNNGVPDRLVWDDEKTQLKVV